LHDKPSEAPLTGGDVPEQDGSEDPGASLEPTRDVASRSHAVTQADKASLEHTTKE